ncbi:hypothetical protein D9619_009517 [Psilocybe cf. subviscida]|uniref:Uncharacterized protein n=1 Tax=Psilocybe cf. subviscida TaxID=2480587 RepID=A0A8H5BVK6_9AGAR|nr:hypothetical protein D9619_009517 [Psilocybe cf. subviscida]
MYATPSTPPRLSVPFPLRRAPITGVCSLCPSTSTPSFSTPAPSCFLPDSRATTSRCGRLYRRHVVSPRFASGGANPPTPRCCNAAHRPLPRSRTTSSRFAAVCTAPALIEISRGRHTLQRTLRGHPPLYQRERPLSDDEDEYMIDQERREIKLRRKEGEAAAGVATHDQSKDSLLPHDVITEDLVDDQGYGDYFT